MSDFTNASFRLDGKVAIVTGAGGRGNSIGRAYAIALANAGASVIVADLNGEGAQTVADEINAAGGKAVAVQVDITDTASVEAMAAKTTAAFGGIDILVNNAGAASPGRFESLDDIAWQRDIDTKLFAQIRCTRAVLPHLRKSPAPRVVNVNAVYAKYPDPAFFATTVNRAACLSFNKALALEYGPEGILVNSVNIGFVETPQWENIRARRAPDSSAEEFFADMAREEVPLGRFGTVDEVSGLIAFLVSDRGSYITGASIDVAGGMGKYV